MSAFRNARSIPPVALAHQYRLNIAPRKKAPVHIIRTRHVKEEEMPDVSIDINDVEYDVHQRSTSRSSYLDEAEEDDFYFRSDSPITPKANDKYSAVRIYEIACKKNNLLPIGCVKKGLQSTHLVCHATNLNFEECKCICYALYHTLGVESIDFEENGIGFNSTKLFAEVVCQSPTLTHIRIANNNLKSEGTEAICQAVEGNRWILLLDISGNGLVESDGEYVRSLVENTDSLRELYLGHNNLSDKGIISISKAVKVNKTLRVLDLQWNHIRLQGAQAIGAALEDNTSLEVVNLAWNGLHKEGAYSIANALSKNKSLVELDLTCNRLSEVCVAAILKGLNHNTTLEILHFGQNSISTKSALVMLHQIDENKTSALKCLNLGNLEVEDKFENMYKEMKKSRDIEIKYGQVLSTERKPLAPEECDDEKALMHCNPLTVLMECMRLQNLRLIDFFKSLDSDKSNMICIKELCDGMIKVSVPIKRQTLLKLLRKLDNDGNGKLDYGEMTQAQKLHRQNIRKILAVSGVDFDKTEIGKVSTLLRKIMSSNYIMKKSVTSKQA